MKIFIKTFGCRTNIYDSELIKTHIKEHEVINNEDEADVVLINSCTVTNGADSGLKSYINTVNKKGAKVVLTGCAGVSLGEQLYREKKIFALLPASKKSSFDALFKQGANLHEKGDLNFIEKAKLQSFQTHTKAFVKIQEGCDFNCSYCIIPSVRGRSRSLLEFDILNQAKMLVESGHQEIVLTGTNIGSFGKHEGSSLAQLLEKLSLIKGLKRIRLGSLEPAQLDERFMEILSEKIIERHLHIALQHTCEDMLKIMRRRSHSKDDLALFTSLHDKGFALGSDFIIGHPGESKERFDKGFANFKHFGLTHLHAFIYSPRFGTRSALMKDTIPKDIAKARLHLLKDHTDKTNLAFRKANKVELEVLVEAKKGEFYEGYDQFFNKIKINCAKNIQGKFIKINDYSIQKECNYAEYK